MLTIMQCKNSNNNIIEVNYRLKMSLRFEVKREIANQISNYFQIKSYAVTFKSTKSNHLTNQISTISICFKYFSYQIFESPLISTTLWCWRGQAVKIDTRYLQTRYTRPSKTALQDDCHVCKGQRVYPNHMNIIIF